MEDLLGNNNLLELKVDEETKSHIIGIAQWANVTAIIALVNLMLSVVSTIYIVGRTRSYVAGDTAALGVVKLLITVTISLLLNLNLLAAARNLKIGIQTGDQGFFDLGLRKLATYFKIIGIILIVALAIIVLIFICVLLFSASRGRF